MSASIAKRFSYPEIFERAAQLVELPKKSHREMQALGHEKAARFLEAAREDRFGLLFELLLVTGARPPEALAWTWADPALSR